MYRRTKHAGNMFTDRVCRYVDSAYVQVWEVVANMIHDGDSRHLHLKTEVSRLVLLANHAQPKPANCSNAAEPMTFHLGEEAIGGRLVSFSDCHIHIHLFTLRHSIIFMANRFCSRNSRHVTGISSRSCED